MVVLDTRQGFPFRVHDRDQRGIRCEGHDRCECVNAHCCQFFFFELDHLDGLHRAHVPQLHCAIAVAVCCSVLQCGGVCCSVLQCGGVCWSVLQCVAVWCSVMEWCRVVQRGAVCCSVLQCVAV